MTSRNSFLALFLMTSFLYGERLPIKSFSTADGLAHDHINQIYRDSKGYLWIATDEGLSRFDGYDFTNFTTADGLPHPHVNGILEVPGKGYWLATDGGLCWFDGKHFTVYRPPGGAESLLVNSIALDSMGAVWLGTNGGLFRKKGDSIETVDSGKAVTSLHFDESGGLWIATFDGVYRRDTNGAVAHFLDGYINSLFSDSKGRLWVLSRTGGLAMISGRVFTTKDGLPGNDIRSMYEVEPGRYWVGTLGGLVQMDETPAGMKFHVYTTANGLSDNRIYKLETDGAGNLWIGTNHAGIQRIARDGFTSYGEEDGLRHSEFAAFSETRDGTLVLVSGDNDQRTLHWFDGNRFHAIPLQLPQGERGFAFGSSQHAFEDRDGRWWLPGLSGLYRYPRVENMKDLGALRAALATPIVGCAVNRVYEDSRGDVWFSTTNYPPCKDPNQLFVWRRESATVMRFDAKEAIGQIQWSPASFAEDKAGALWVGLEHDGGLVRIRNGRAERFMPSDGVPPGTIQALLVDSKKRLWVGSFESGLARIDDPDATKPRFRLYTTSSGLSSNQIWSLVEDNAGYIYLGTGRGVDRLDPSGPTVPRSVRKFTASDGFVRGEVRAVHRDRRGVLWFATTQGVAKLAPGPPVEPLASPVAITELRVNGVSVVPATDLKLEPDLRRLEILFSGIDYSTSGQLRYQYKLEGADRDWNPPSTERRVNYANLSPGNYRFWVRAENSADAASISFMIAPPLWQRWWFRLSVLAVLALIGYAAHRFRLTRMIALERLRAQISADLHDDIGSGLSQIAVLSEVARWQVDSRTATATSPLSRIGEISREMVDSMSDIVWTINPRHDHLGDLIYRMRRFADEILTGRNIEFDLVVQGSSEIPLDATVRRDIFLIFKESLHNAIRHSECSTVNVLTGAEAGYLTLRVVDNGKGFDVDHVQNGDGAGLQSMRQRAARMHGSIIIDSGMGRGTSVQLRAPLPKRHYINM